MSLRRFPVLLLLLTAAVSVAPADTELVLEDGQVLTGVDVYREGEHYVVELESGKLLTIPAELVSEVRLVEEKKEAPDGLTPAEAQQLAGEEPVEPSGLRDEGPQTLAGEEVVPPRKADQLEALGPAARFRRGTIDPEWVPSSDWDNDPANNNFSPVTWVESLIDPHWRPESGLPDVDVLELGESQWRAGIIDPTWYPEDGFSKQKAGWVSARARKTSAADDDVPPLPPLTRTTESSSESTREASAAPSQRKAIYAGSTNVRPSVDVVFRPAVNPVRIDPRRCADRIFRPLIDQAPADAPAGSPSVQTIVDGRFLDLPIQLHEARLQNRVRAVFTADGGECRLLSGDLGPLLGVELSHDHAVSHAAKEYNEALGSAGAVKMKTTDEKIDYAFAVSSLIDPDVSGHLRGELVPLRTAAQLQEIIADRPSECALAAKKQRKVCRSATEAFATPKIASGAEGDVITFFTWSSTDGGVTRHAVFLAGDGKVSTDRETIARHVGDHDD